MLPCLFKAEHGVCNAPCNGFHLRLAKAARGDGGRADAQAGGNKRRGRVVRHSVFICRDAHFVQPGLQLFARHTGAAQVYGHQVVVRAAAYKRKALAHKGCGQRLCICHNALLIFDEVQTGVGRTGELYACMHYGVTPDLLTTAKALGGGFPVGALLATEECASVMTVGTHGTTYGGNPLASAVAGKVLDLINTPEMLNGVKQRHDWFVERLNSINHHYSLFSEVRGLGLLIGCVLNADYAGQAKQISQEAVKAGVMVLIAGGNVVRFAPALNVSEEEVTTGLDRFAAACEHFVSRGSS